MTKRLRIAIYQVLLVFLLASLFVCVSINDLTAQTVESKPALENQLQPLRSSVGILAFTGNLRWRTFYLPVAGGELDQESQTELQIEFRNLKMLSPQVGLGYRFFATAFLSGFFESGGLGGFGAGPLIRYYPLKTTRWQPYVQGNVLAGFNTTLGDAIGINDVEGFRFRSGLRGGLGYKFSNAFGIFIELGPSWEYDEGFQLDSRAIQFNVGIELFRF